MHQLTILVTGATGTVGRPLVDGLLAEGARVRALTRDPATAGLPPQAEVTGGDYVAPGVLTEAARGERQEAVAQAASGPEPQGAVAQTGSGPEPQGAVAQAASGPEPQGGGARTGSGPEPQGAAARAPIEPAGSQAPAAPARQPRNALELGPRARRVIRAVARVVNPLVLRMAGRKHMPIVGVLHHRGRKTGRPYATPVGVRPAPGGGYVIPLTFSEASQWYQNILAAGWCVITYRGEDHTGARPAVVDRVTAGPAYPRYERLALRLIGINEFLWLAEANDGSRPAPRGA